MHGNENRIGSKGRHVMLGNVVEDMLVYAK